MGKRAEVKRSAREEDVGLVEVFSRDIAALAEHLATYVALLKQTKNTAPLRSK